MTTKIEAAKAAKKAADKAANVPTNPKDGPSEGNADNDGTTSVSLHLESDEPTPADLGNPEDNKPAPANASDSGMQPGHRH